MQIAIRPASARDVPDIVAMVYELALFERAVAECHLTEEQLHTALFAAHPKVFCHVACPAEDPAGAPVGMALWFLTFSTWEGVHGIYLEDLYVRPAARGTGAGKALVATLARICVTQGYPRLEWAVLDWNPARAFYAALGAGRTPQWLPYRLVGAALTTLAGSADASIDPPRGVSPAASPRAPTP